MEVAVNKCPHNGCFIWIQIILILLGFLIFLKNYVADSILSKAE